MQVFRENRSLSLVLGVVVVMCLFLAHTVRVAQAAATVAGNKLQYENNKENDKTLNEGLESKEIALQRIKRSSDYHDNNPQAHKILVRQTQGEADLGQDDLVASLIRQRDDFIAAAAVPESPLPQQTMRRNLNSGL